MKGKLIEDPNFFPEIEMPFGLLRGNEYLILGITEIGYLIYNEIYEVDVVPLDRIQVTENTIPDFWEADGERRLVPKEWQWDQFLSLNGEPYLELWEYEIWSITQFASIRPTNRVF